MDEKVTILDEYGCLFMSDRLRIKIDGMRDPSLVDIMSEIHGSNGRIYCDGSYYMYDNDYDIFESNQEWYLDLFVKRQRL